MSLNLSLPKAVDLKPRIIVMGVGGAGGNAVNNMVNSGLEGVEFIVANTDAQALAFSKADCRVQMGGGITQGLGAGMRPEVGEQSATDSLPEIMGHLDGAHMLFIAAGMGGGTGTGAAPVIAQAARDKGILTVAIVTKPFQFEGARRMAIAEAGIDRLYDSVDTLITIPNQNLFRVANEQTTMSDAFAMADEVLHSGVKGVTDLMVVPGLINLDFADVRTVMDEMGKAMMGTGEATGERRAIEAAESAISNPLLDDVSLKGAKGVLINITGGKDLTLYEVDEAASLIRGQVDQEANIIIGSALDSDLEGIVRVSVVATGVNDLAQSLDRPIIEHDSSSRTVPINPDIDSIDGLYGSVADMDDMRLPEAVAPVEAHQEQPRYMRDEDMGFEAPLELEKELADERIDRRVERRKPEPRQESQTVVKRPFGFFGRKKTVPVARHTPAPKLPNTGDLFDDMSEDELEIPSFLRRQGR